MLQVIGVTSISFIQTQNNLIELINLTIIFS